MLAELDYDDIRYFVRASETPSRSWDDVPEDVKQTFLSFGHSRGGAKFLSGSVRSTRQKSLSTRQLTRISRRRL